MEPISLRGQLHGSTPTHPFLTLETDSRFEIKDWRQQVELAKRPYSDSEKRNHLLFGAGVVLTVAGLVFIGSLYEGDACGNCSPSRRDGLASLALGVSITGAAVAIYAFSQGE